MRRADARLVQPNLCIHVYTRRPSSIVALLHTSRIAPRNTQTPALRLRPVGLGPAAAWPPMTLIMTYASLQHNYTVV